MRNKFTVFLKDGDAQSPHADYWWRKITAIFKELSAREYTAIPQQFHLELRVSGPYVTFDDAVGCNGLRYMRKKGVVANSISWDAADFGVAEDLDAFMERNLPLAFEQMARRLAKEKITIKPELHDDLKALLNSKADM